MAALSVDPCHFKLLVFTEARAGLLVTILSLAVFCCVNDVPPAGCRIAEPWICTPRCTPYFSIWLQRQEQEVGRRFFLLTKTLLFGRSSMR